MTKFTLAREHLFHFQTQQFLELEDVLTTQQLVDLKQTIENTLLQTTGQKKSFLTLDHLFTVGYDLHQHNESLKKWVTNRQFSEIAATLAGEKVLRLGYDELFPCPRKTSSARCYIDNLPYKGKLSDISAIQGVVCGLVICLQGFQEEIETPLNNSIFPKKEGNMVFFSPEKEIDFKELQHRIGQEFLLIVYAGKTAIYALNEKAPHAHVHKRQGYVFGDRLKDHLNPIVYRSR